MHERRLGSDYRPSQAENAPDDEILETGWQQRLRGAIDRESTVEHEMWELERLVRIAQRDGTAIVADGGLRDSILFTEAVRRTLEKRNPDDHRSILTTEQSVDDAINAAYGISAMADPDKPLGHSVGYATGQGKKLSEATRIIVRTPGNTNRLILGGEISKDTAAVLIVDEADNDSLYNQLLLSALKEQQMAGTAPLTIFLSRRFDRRKRIAEFFGVEPANLHVSHDWGDEGNEFDTSIETVHLSLPKNIHYEQAREPYDINQANRASELITSIVKGELHPDSSVLAFLRDDDMEDIITRSLRRESRAKSIESKDGKYLETDRHIIRVLSEDVPLQSRLRLQLGAPDLQQSRYKKEIVLSRLPAEMLGITQKFDVVIDTHRSRERGGYYSITREEADRRANCAKPEGTCYRLTTESEYRQPKFEEGSSGFVLLSSDESKFDEAIRAAGKDPQTFPKITEQPLWGYGRRVEAKAELAPEVERWVKLLGVEPHVAKLVEALDKQGKQNIGLAMAACTRETRFMKADRSWDKAVDHFDIPGSDLLLRLKILAESIKPEQRKPVENEEDDYHRRAYRTPFNFKEEVNTLSLGHIEGMLRRWGSALNASINRDLLVQQIRDLDYEALSEILAQTMPERLAYKQEGSDNDIVFLNSQVGSHIMEWGKSSVAYAGGSDLFIVVSQTGQENRFITTAHPLTPELAARLLPDKVKLDSGQPYIDQRRGKVVQEHYVKVFVPKDYVIRQRRSVPATEADMWETVRTTRELVKDGVAEAVLQAEQERRSAVETLSKAVEDKLTVPVGVLQKLMEQTGVGPFYTSARDRLQALEDLQVKLERGEVKDPAEAENELARHFSKIGILAKDVARKSGWSHDWYTKLQDIAANIPNAITGHAFAQEVIESGITQEEIRRRVRDQILSTNIETFQKGREVKLDEIIDTILDELVR